MRQNQKSWCSSVEGERREDRAAGVFILGAVEAAIGRSFRARQAGRVKRSRSSTRPLGARLAAIGEAACRCDVQEECNMHVRDRPRRPLRSLLACFADSRAAGPGLARVARARRATPLSRRDRAPASSGRRPGRRWRGRRPAWARASRASPSRAAASTRWATGTARSTCSRSSATDGKPLWKARVGAGLERRVRRPARHADRGRRAASTRSAPRATSCAVEAATGKERWRKSLARDFGGRDDVDAGSGSESPLVDGDRADRHARARATRRSWRSTSAPARRSGARRVPDLGPEGQGRRGLLVGRGLERRRA